MALELDLSALGLTAAQEREYHSLVVDGGGTVDMLAARWQRPVHEVRRVLGSLRDLGLVEVATFEGDVRRWFPTAPDVALQGLLNSRRHALSVAEMSVAALTEMFRRDLNHADVGDLVEVVLGADAVRRRFLQLELSAREEVCTFVDARPVAVSPEENTAEAQALDRGVTFRVVIERAAFEDDATVAEAREALGANALVRAVPKVPTKLLVTDGVVAMAPLSVRGYAAAAVVIRAPSLVHSLVTLFESVWAAGIPVVLDLEKGLVDGPAAGPDPDDLALLSLMLSGFTDEVVGKQLGMSGRTVQRRLRALMDFTGSTSRMQLGWEASERGWVTRRSFDS
ncbi:Sugar-specific transcriptional regulator TrmB [Micromonospora purpureochromogenes]|uniref:Sugar-specific transcriptional regulator TrmB n=1 Tax=Micromonospora purpureochromogenes TaxID=47872 RepID=A0A1C4Z6C2_9ACTN|nr:helix-turn-helix domain-containing protein [Micromonospora purpureochromogenes]SCF28473.1 Sugar-specific transcriptional regulator TrmB [Micromonospora purpureochromogenes]